MLKISYLEQLNSKIFALPNMDVGTLARAGCGSGVIDKILSPQNRPLNLDNWYKSKRQRCYTQALVLSACFRATFLGFKFIPSPINRMDKVILGGDILQLFTNILDVTVDGSVANDMAIVVNMVHQQIATVNATRVAIHGF